MQDFFGNGTVKIALENYFKDYMVDKSGVYLDYTMTKANFDELNLKEYKPYMDGVYFVVDEDKSETTMYVVNGNYKDPIENSTRLLSALYSEYTNAPHTIITKD
jgi:expansin (peptidoglycan-binding protein)